MNAITDIVADGMTDMPACIAEAIGTVMGKVKNVEKQGENKFHNYKFARVEDLIFQVQPALVEAGLVITQDELSHEMAADAVMLATYAFSLSHKTGVTWGPVRQTGMASLKNSKGGYDDKALNKCHTAARKYFILGLFQVPAGDLPDVDAEEDKAGPTAEQKAIDHLRSVAVDAQVFKGAWEANKAAWKDILSPDAYARVVGEMKRLAAEFKTPAPEPASAPAPADDFGIPEDEIPF